MTSGHGGRGIATKSYIIALEEHYYDPEVKRHASGLDAIAAPATVQRLDDLSEQRLQEMDEAGMTGRCCRIRCRGFRSSMLKLPCHWRAAPTTASTRQCAPTPTGSLPLRLCPPPTQKQQPMSSNERSSGSASRERRRQIFP